MNNRLVKKLLAAGLVSAAMFAQAVTEVVDGIEWTYTISGGEASVSSASPATGDITIPSTLGECQVTSVGDRAFESCSGLTSVTIPVGVTNVGSYAFFDCIRLKSVNLPCGIKCIGDDAFCGCAELSGITIPVGVERLGCKAFGYCGRLKSLVIPSSVSEMDFGIFDNCTGLVSVVISEGVSSIGNGMFMCCKNLSKVSLPSTLLRVGDSAFSNCESLKDLTIPESVESLGSYPFDNSDGLSMVVFRGAPPKRLIDAYLRQDVAIRYNSLYEDEWLPVIKAFGFTNAEAYAPPKPDGGPYTEVVGGIEWTFVVSNGVASLGGGDRERPAVGLLVGGELTIPEVLGGCVVADVGVAAFAFHSNIVSVTFPQTITNIGGAAFYECVGLRGIELNEGLVSIENGAFAKCTSLEMVRLPLTMRRLGSNLGDYGFEDGITSEGHYHDVSTNDLGYVQERAGDSLTGSYERHGYGVFEICTSLSEVVLNDGLLEIGSGAFFGCSSLTDIEITDSVKSIGGRCVSCNRFLSHVYDFDSLEMEGGECSVITRDQELYGDSQTILPHGVFEKCDALRSVKLPKVLDYLGPNAFKDCVLLKSVVMPRSLHVINEGTFSGCGRLAAIDLPDDLELLGGVELSPQHIYTSDSLSQNGGKASVLTSEQVIEYDGDWMIDALTENGGKCSVVSNLLSDTRWLAGDYQLRIPTDESGWLESSPMYWCVEQLGVCLPDCRRVWLEGPRRTEFHPTKPYYSSASSGVFFGCSKLTSVKVPESVRRIADYAFYDCNSMTSISLPSKLQLLGYEVFGGESSLFCVETPWLNFGELWEVFPSHSYVTNLVLRSGPKHMELKEFRRKIEKWVEEDAYLSDDEREQFYEYYAEEGWWSADPILAGFGNLCSLTLPEGLESFDVSLGLECCPRLKTFNLPRSLRRVGCSAFSFSSLDKVEMPESLDEIGDFVFSNCHVTNVVFTGCAPSCVSPNAFVGENVWDPTMDAPLDLVVSVYPGTVGWDGDKLSPELPEDGLWPCNAAIFKRRAIEFVRQQLSKAAGGDGQLNDFRYYDAEVAKMVSVPQSWLSAHGLIEDDGTGCANVNLSPLGSRTMWQSYVAGLDPTDENSKFTASVTMVEGKLVVSYSPELSAAEAAKRKYTTWGKTKLQDVEWVEVPSGSEADYNFFKVSVEMK